MKVYIRVTLDKYELITSIADTSAELARICGVEQGTVLKGCRRYERGVYKRSQWRRVEIEEDGAADNI